MNTRNKSFEKDNSIKKFEHLNGWVKIDLFIN